MTNEFGWSLPSREEERPGDEAKRLCKLGAREVVSPWPLTPRPIATPSFSKLWGTGTNAHSPSCTSATRLWCSLSFSPEAMTGATLRKSARTGVLEIGPRLQGRQQDSHLASGDCQASDLDAHSPAEDSDGAFGRGGRMSGRRRRRSGGPGRDGDRCRRIARGSQVPAPRSRRGGRPRLAARIAIRGDRFGARNTRRHGEKPCFAGAAAVERGADEAVRRGDV